MARAYNIYVLTKDDWRNELEPIIGVYTVKHELVTYLKAARGDNQHNIQHYRVYTMRDGWINLSGHDEFYSANEFLEGT